MKLSKDELKEKIDSYEIPEETKISLLEDIEDSVDVEQEPVVNEFEEKYNKLLQDYKSRFFEKTEQPAKEERPIIEEQKEKIYWDVKEI